MQPHRNPKFRDEAIEWARGILAHKDQYVILDTETTGLKENDVIIQISITDLDGNELLNSLVRPTKRKRMSADATAIHGIKMAHLKNAPTLAELMPKIESIMSGKKAIIYNAEFDIRMFIQTADQDDCRFFNLKAQCAMLTYSIFVGEWSDYHGDFRYQPLLGGDHSAIGDCRATLRVIHEMAEAELSNPKPRMAAAEPASNESAVMENKKPWWMFWRRD